MERYNNYPQSLLPNLIQVPKEAPAQFENWLKDTGKTAGQWIQGQAVPQLISIVATGKTPAQLFRSGGSRVLNNPAVANGIATFAATRFGEPVVNGLKTFANSPMSKKIMDWADWIF